MFQHIDSKRAVVGGLTGTAAMTVLMLMAPLMGLPPMNIGKMLGSVMGGVVALGWIAHFMIGTALALVYAAVFARRRVRPMGFARPRSLQIPFYATRETFVAAWVELRSSLGSSERICRGKRCLLAHDVLLIAATKDGRRPFVAARCRGETCSL